MMEPIRFRVERCRARLTPHIGRTLVDNLLGTERLLHRWGARDAVKRAGLVHSVYGTVHSYHRSWLFDDSATVRAVIGAEELAYLFCVLNRPRA